MTVVRVEPRVKHLARRSQSAISRRLIEYEVNVRLTTLKASQKSLAVASKRLSDIELDPLDSPALARALKPFPVPQRTLDTIHLSTLIFLQARGLTLEPATDDKRLMIAAQALGLPCTPL
jgi:hypothetical protein